MTADLIGQETSSSALVFGLMSLTDKVANGLGIVLIQQYVPCAKVGCILNRLCKVPQSDSFSMGQYGQHLTPYPQLFDITPLEHCPQPLLPFHPEWHRLVPYPSTSCVDFYRNVLFAATTGAAVLGALGVAGILAKKALCSRKSAFKGKNIF